jgi:hypothetical protein
MQSAFVANRKIFVGGRYLEAYDNNNGGNFIPLEESFSQGVASITIPTTQIYPDDPENLLLVVTKDGVLYRYTFDYIQKRVYLDTVNFPQKIIYADVFRNGIIYISKSGQLSLLNNNTNTNVNIGDPNIRFKKFSTFNGDIAVIDSNGNLMMYISSYKDDLLGITSKSSIQLKYLTAGINFIDVDIKYDSLIAIDNHGAIYISGSEGENFSSKYVNNPNRKLTGLVKLGPTDIKFKSVSKGGEITAFIDFDNNLWTCCTTSLMGISRPGSNDISPLTMIMKNVASVSCGYDFIFAKDLNGQVYVFGDNLFNQLGLVSNNKTIQPVPILLEPINYATLLFNQDVLINYGQNF